MEMVLHFYIGSRHISKVIILLEALKDKVVPSDCYLIKEECI